MAVRCAVTDRRTTNKVSLLSRLTGRDACGALSGLLAQVGFHVLQQSGSFVTGKAIADAPADLGMGLSLHGEIDRGDQKDGADVGVPILSESIFQLTHRVGSDGANYRSVYRHRSPRGLEHVFLCDQHERR